MEQQARVPYTIEEYTQMVHFYYLGEGNLQRAARLYHARWPGRRHPDPQTIGAAHRRFMATGNVDPAPQHVDRGRPRHVLVPEMEELIEDLFEVDPNTSVREVSREVGASVSRVHAVIADTGKHPYHYRQVQELVPLDYVRRVAFCGGLLAQVRQFEDFLQRILWTDESTFTRNGMFNQRNYHYWSLENPRLTRATSFQHRWAINVWAGIIDGRIIGPVFLPPRLNGAAYLEFLVETLPILLEDLPLNLRINMLYQHDGAPPHSTRAVADHLDDRFPERWIGRNGPIGWPARSPDLTPLDFFLWGSIKEKVYRRPVREEEDCRRRIEAAFEELRGDEGMIRRATASLVRRAELVLERGGRHIEQFLQ